MFEILAPGNVAPVGRDAAAAADDAAGVAVVGCKWIASRDVNCMGVALSYTVASDYIQCLTGVRASDFESENDYLLDDLLA